MVAAAHDIPLALPYNHDPAYPDWLRGHAAGVAEVYLPIHASVAPTARPWAGPADPAAYRAELRPLAAALASVGVRANLVLNLPVWTEGRARVPREVEDMRAIFGPRMLVTVSDFPLARDLRAALPDLALSVSCAAQVATPRQARSWIDGVGVESLVISREINRRPAQIALLRAEGVALKLVLDDACLPECPSLVSHHALMMFADHALGRGACMMSAERRARPWLLAQKDLVPALLPRYAGLVDVAKVEGRARSLAEIARKRALYLAAESWAHVLGHYVEPPEIGPVLETCDRVCERCGHCAAVFQVPPLAPA